MNDEERRDTGLPVPDAMDEEGNPLWRRESIEEEHDSFFGPIMGSWMLTVVLVGIFIASLVIWGVWGSIGGMIDSFGPPQGPQPQHEQQGHDHGSQHGDLVKLPPEVQKHVKGGYEYGTIGSRKWIFGDHGWTELQRGHRDDSKLVVADTEFNSFTVKVYTRGCGRGWTKTDKNGAKPGKGVRNTRCNMLYHQTGEERIDSGYDWTIPSYHRDPGRG